MDESTGTAWAILLIALYFFPAIVAKLRGHNRVGAIATLNIFLGWTFLGWVGALVWAMCSDNPGRKAP